MNKKNIFKWYNALRSRKYRQGHGHLLDYSGKMCALGVADKIFNTKHDYSKIREILGINTDITSKIIQMNDGSRLKFYQIARWIKRNLLKEIK